MENGKWKMENGKWKMENGKWKMKNGPLPLALCPSRCPSPFAFFVAEAAARVASKVDQLSDQRIVEILEAPKCVLERKTRSQQPSIGLLEKLEPGRLEARPSKPDDVQTASATRHTVSDNERQAVLNDL